MNHPAQGLSPRHSQRSPRLLRSLALLACAGMTGLATPAWSAAETSAQTPTEKTTEKPVNPGHAATQAAREHRAAIEARYKTERQACLDGHSGQDRATCLKEAGAARSEALRSRLDNGESRAQLQANALARCKVQPASERASCEIMARGQGMESGSVESGGVIKQLVTRSVGAAPAPAGAASAPVAAPSATARTPARSSAASNQPRP